jgi:hypothetical protein
MATSSLLNEDEAQRIAVELTAKYGADALEFVRARAERAQSIGDELAHEAWQCVLDATQSLLDT